MRAELHFLHLPGLMRNYKDTLPTESLCFRSLADSKPQNRKFNAAIFDFFPVYSPLMRTYIDSLEPFITSIL